MTTSRKSKPKRGNKTQGLQSLIEARLNRTVTITLQGEKRRMSVRRVILQQLVLGAAGGSLPAITALDKWVKHAINRGEAAPFIVKIIDD